MARPEDKRTEAEKVFDFLHQRAKSPEYALTEEQVNLVEKRFYKRRRAPDSEGNPAQVTYKVENVKDRDRLWIYVLVISGVVLAAELFGYFYG